MNVKSTPVFGLKVIEPEQFRDRRGWLSETFVQKNFVEEICETVFVQDNESFSRYGVIRGLHYQLAPMAQAKLVRAVQGRILDVAVDVRKGSPTFGYYEAVELSDLNRRQLFIPRGFAHGFVVLSDTALVHYKCDNYYSPEHEAGILYSDPQIAVSWPVAETQFVVSEKDMALPLLENAVLFEYDK